MGSIENGTSEIESGEVEKMESSEIFTHQNEPLAPGNQELSAEVMAADKGEQEKILGFQNIEEILVSNQKSSTGVQETRPSHGEMFQKHLNNFSVLVNKEHPPSNGSAVIGNVGELTDNVSISRGNGILEEIQKSAAIDPGQLGIRNERSNAKSRKGKDKPSTPVTRSWVLRTKSQEKPKVLEADNTVKEGNVNEEPRKRRKKKRVKSSSGNEFARTRTHLKYLLQRIKFEQNLIDAYSAEGWKGLSIEKLKPEKELQRAKSHILDYKLRIRNLFQNLDLSLDVGKLPDFLFDSVGEIDSEDIFCAKCGSKDLTLDNDIILCDGACERGFHLFCLEPPLLKAEIPPDDEGWLCRGCDCKDDCLDILKDFQGIILSINDSWEKIFPEAVALGNKTDGGSGSSDDSEDDDYDPDQLETVEKVQGDESSSDESNYVPASNDMPVAPDDEKYHGLPSDDSADNDFDPAAQDQDTDVVQSSSSSDFSSDSEDLAALLDDTDIPGNDSRHMSPPSKGKCPFTGSTGENPQVVEMKGQSLKAELAYLLKTSDAPVSSKRHVERLDYKKLLQETYKNSSSDSSDEDFDGATTKRRKSNDKTVLVSPDKTPIKKHTDDENPKERKRPSNRTIKRPFDEDTNESPVNALASSSGGKRPSSKRLGEAVTQGLLASFNESQYPTRAVKENLANRLGISVRQVSKWFENARWSHNHRPQMESKVRNTPQKGQKFNAPNATPAQSSTAGMNVEKLLNNSSDGRKSGTGKSAKRKTRDEEPSSLAESKSAELARSSSSNRRQTRSSKRIINA